MKLMEWPKYSWCSAKESTMLKGSSQYTFRNHLTAMPWKAVIWDQNIVKP